MWAIALAIVTAAIGFIAKLGHDVWAEHQARKAIAAAIGGELSAYIRLLQPEKTIENFKHLAAMDHETRKAVLPGLFNLPTGHPVFDRVADKIGLLAPDAARGISEAYNIITSGRLMVSSFSSNPFINLPDPVQKIRIETLAEMFIGEIEGIRRTITLLESLSRQHFICHMFS